MAVDEASLNNFNNTTVRPKVYYYFIHTQINNDFFSEVSFRKKSCAWVRYNVFHLKCNPTYNSMVSVSFNVINITRQKNFCFYLLARS